MPAWDIDPSGVSGVVNKTKGVAEDFDAQLKAIDTALNGGLSNCGSGLVQQAISDYASSAQPDFRFVVFRTGQAITAAIEATNAYIQGDLDMAANAQLSATAAPPEDDDMTPAPGHIQR